MRRAACLLAVAACTSSAQKHAPDATPTAPDAMAALPACSAPADATFRLERDRVIAPDFVGFGAQYNANAYAQISADAGITTANVGDMERAAIALGPRHVRIFWNPTATPDQVASFEKTVALAAQSGATINVTYWHGPYPDPVAQMKTFSDELVRLRQTLGADAVRYVTIQNEVNSTQVTMTLYEQLYRELDRDLRDAGERQHVSFVCGDLLRDGQAAWFSYFADHMTDVCDGYSVHIYWNYFDVPYMVTRLTEVHDIVAAMPAGARKPLYVTEFGARGYMPNGEPQPGLHADGTLLGLTNENAFQHAWFSLLAARLGYVSTLKWDAFFAKYDNGEQYFSAIGIPPAWKRKPVFYSTQLLARVVPAGWSSVEVTGGDGTSDSRLLAGFIGPDGHASVIALNKGTAARTVDVTGLPPGTAVQVLVWHGEGDGTLSLETATTTAGCTTSLQVPARSVAAVTTLPVAL